MKLPVPGYSRLSTIIGDKKTNPPIPGYFPMSRPTWYRGVKAGRYPEMTKLGPNMSAVSNAKLNQLFDSIEQEDEAKKLQAVEAKAEQAEEFEAGKDGEDEEPDEVAA